MELISGLSPKAAPETQRPVKLSPNLLSPTLYVVFASKPNQTKMLWKATMLSYGELSHPMLCPRFITQTGQGEEGKQIRFSKLVLFLPSAPSAEHFPKTTGAGRRDSVLSLVGIKGQISVRYSQD